MSPRMKKSTYYDRLAKVPMFRTLAKRDLQRIGKFATLHEAEEGDILAKEGQRGQEFFVIASGKATVKRKNRKVAQLKAGDFFGELALLEKVPRNATVVADTDMELYVVSRQDFAAVLREVPEIAVKLLSGLAKRLSEADASSV